MVLKGVNLENSEELSMKNYKGEPDLTKWMKFQWTDQKVYTQWGQAHSDNTTISIVTAWKSSEKSSQE